jgi:hypothetical protein
MIAGKVHAKRFVLCVIALLVVLTIFGLLAWTHRNEHLAPNPPLHTDSDLTPIPDYP